ncbi:GAF sensor hybrid histidine kinase [[Leptolyngbya] sp. PCC 7376]|uniref:hybrid sensor histidine kinase/response regulator n=1 Tax=[Leptolyngbya] sp. PCC 7376 TaxID=111781 RepID=UPI00029F3F3A|nr:ATP-binding protein [[Leptolyngbya] sp. PCC 7376]AFY37530.1 GAF sensor hybrid histidine kinase [[Leptolyngbya] sp. PCC 7376]
MNLIVLTPDISWIVPQSEMQSFCQLWQEFGMAENRIYLNSDHFAAAGMTLQYDIFQLVVDTSFTAVLWGNAQDNLQDTPDEQELSDSYELSVSFEPQLISDIIKSLVKQKCKLSQLKQLKTFALPKVSQLPSELTLALLGIGRSPHQLDGEQEDINPAAIPNRPLDLLLNHRLEQERILNNVTHRIYQNKDLMVTVRLALEQVQKLLRVDRLLVYQFDVSTEGSVNTVADQNSLNRVTFEVLDDSKIPSLSQHEESLPPELRSQLFDYYQEGLHLAVSETSNNPRFELCPPQFESIDDIDAPQSVLALPLTVDNQLWGLLIAHQCTTQRRWRKNEISFLYHVADYLAIAVLQARSYQQLQEQKINLETLAQQRAKELEDALLSAQVASQSKREFIHIVSHELLTPLTSIIGLSNTLRYWSAPENAKKFSIEKQQSYLQSIHTSGVKLRNLLQDILDFSQTEAARSVLDLQQFSLRQLCYTLMNAFQEMSDRQGLTLNFMNRIEPEQDIFCADLQRVEKILTHLLANAIKFTSNGGEVTLTIWREGQGDVLFQVKDTGIGITPQQMPLLFEKFQQLEPSISRSHDGAGFGLALVKQLVEIHQGQIHVTSTPHQGSTFTVRIPYQNRRANQSEEKKLSSNLGGAIVLVSQDEEAATLICDVLTATDYQVIWLIDSAIALGQITILQPSLVLLDTQQADEPVERIIEKLQNSPQTQQIPVLLVDDSLTKPQWRQLQKRGFRDHIEKPIDSESLIHIINYHIENHSVKFSTSPPEVPQT